MANFYPGTYRLGHQLAGNVCRTGTMGSRAVYEVCCSTSASRLLRILCVQTLQRRGWARKRSACMVAWKPCVLVQLELRYGRAQDLVKLATAVLHDVLGDLSNWRCLCGVVHTPMCANLMRLSLGSVKRRSQPTVSRPTTWGQAIKALRHRRATTCLIFVSSYAPINLCFPSARFCRYLWRVGSLIVSVANLVILADLVVLGGWCRGKAYQRQKSISGT